MLLSFLTLAYSTNENPQQNSLITHQLRMQAARTPGTVLNLNTSETFYAQLKGKFLAAAQFVGNSMGEGLRNGISYEH